MLGLNQEVVEKSGEKESIFKHFRTWENARAANVFNAATKARLKDLSLKFHLEQTGDRSFALQPVQEIRLTDKVDGDPKTFAITNTFDRQPLRFALRFVGSGKATVNGVTITLPNGAKLKHTGKMLAGEFIISNGNSAWATDKFRKKTADLIMTEPATLPRGTTIISIQNADTSVAANSQFQLTIYTLGEPEHLGD